MARKVPRKVFWNIERDLGGPRAPGPDYRDRGAKAAGKRQGAAGGTPGETLVVFEEDRARRAVMVRKFLMADAAEGCIVTADGTAVRAIPGALPLAEGS